MSIVFNESSILHLQKLAKDVKTSTGVKHRLSDENSMLRLLKLATEAKQQHIRNDLDAFVNELSVEQVNKLKSRGVMVNKAAHQAKR